jgi:hypothetical protein
LLGKSGGGSSSKSSSASLAALQRKLPLIEQRVQAIRGRGFRRRVAPEIVTGRQAQQAGLADLDRVEPRAAQEADQELLRLLGLIPTYADLRQIQSEILQDQVAGYYDSSDKRLALVRDATGSSEAIGEITLAHELTHALDDQRFGIRDEAPGTDDRSTAYTALVEGDATSVMTRYATKYMSGSNLLGALFAGSGGGGPRLPPYVQASLEFPYLEGQRFVDTLFRYAHGWKLVNYAFRFHPPVSTAQILHPLDFVRDVKPLRIRFDLRPLLGRDWRRVAVSSLGEFDTRQLLQRALPADRAASVAATWRGGTYQLWRTGPLPRPGCASPCRHYDSLVLAWRTGAGRDAQTLGAAVGDYVTRGLGGRTRGRDVWSLPGSAAALDTQGGTTALALAPTQQLAEALAVRASAPAAPLRPSPAPSGRR